MKKHLIVFFIFLVTAFGSFAQNEQLIQYEEIKNNIEDESSPYYYPELLKRYQAGDDSLSTKDYRHLYYGFTFQKEYRPYERNQLDVQITELLPSATNQEDFEQLRELTLQYLEINPFSLKLLNYLENFNYNVPEVEPAENEIIKRKFNGIVDAILSTGDGTSIETGYSVNHPSDEYMVMRYLQLKPIKTTVKTHYDMFDLAKNDREIEKIYFDVFRMSKVGTKQMGVTALQVEDNEDVEINAKGLVVGSRDELLEFIPAGSSILFENKLDIDSDGDIDWVVITKEDAEIETSNFAAGHPKYRNFMILTRNTDGVLEPKLTSERVIPCIDCGGTTNDPLQSITIEPSKIIVSSKGGDLIIWERVNEFSFINNEWVLTKETFSTYRKGKREKMQSDVETQKDFGKILLSEFDYYELLQ